jgi:adenylylsulfate kinase
VSVASSVAPAADAGGAVVWLTGLPAAGKSRLADAIAEDLRRRGRAPVVLDGDAVRDALVPRPGYTPEDRDAFYDTLGRLAGLLARQGLIVLVPATAHARRYRAAARERAMRFVEVYVNTSSEECARRDPKGLYARAHAGATPSLPGVGAAYEPPVAPEVMASGGLDDRAVAAVIGRLLGDEKEAGACARDSP